MFIDGKWIYWKEQCEYCTNRKVCDYRENVKEYTKKLEAIEAKVYGSLRFKCDYFILDERVYQENDMGECSHCEA